MLSDSAVGSPAGPSSTSSTAVCPGTGSAQLTVFGKTENWAYQFPLRTSGQTRCQVGKGIRENYLGFGLSNPAGQAFALDRVEVLVAESKTRRI